MATNGKTGRPSKLTPELLAEITKRIAEGDTPEDAAELTGIAPSTFYDWMVRGKSGDEPFGSFRRAVTRALAEFRSNAVRTVLDGDSQGVGFGPAKAALEVLSRRWPKQWAQRVKHELEDAERFMLDALERVCGDPDVLERVLTQKDLRVVFVAFCEELTRLDGEAETPGDSTERRAMH